MHTVQTHRLLLSGAGLVTAYVAVSQVPELNKLNTWCSQYRA